MDVILSNLRSYEHERPWGACSTISVPVFDGTSKSGLVEEGRVAKSDSDTAKMTLSGDRPTVATLSGLDLWSLAPPVSTSSTFGMSIDPRRSTTDFFHSSRHHPAIPLPRPHNQHTLRLQRLYSPCPHFQVTQQTSHLQLARISRPSHYSD